MSSIGDTASAANDITMCLALDARIAGSQQKDHLGTFNKLISRINGLVRLVEVSPENFSVVELRTMLNSALAELVQVNHCSLTDMTVVASNPTKTLSTLPPVYSAEDSP